MQKSIIFIFGPSGVGKSYALDLLKKQGLLHKQIDTDKAERTFAGHSFPSEWDNNFAKVDFDFFIRTLKEELKETKYNGTIVSFPTTHRFTQKNLNLLRQLDVIPMLLWGDEKNCKLAVEKRRNKKGIPLDWAGYDPKNLPTFTLYGSHEYDIFRLEAFQADGSRFSNEELEKKISDFIQKFV